MATLTLDILRRLPKADLHRHLDGSVRVRTIVELAREQGVTLPTYDEAELAKLVVVQPDCPSLVEYLRGFAITNLVLQKAYALTRVFYEACEDAVADGIRYLELRFAPYLHVSESMSVSRVMEAVCEGRALAESSLPIVVRIIICGMRHHEPAVNVALAKLVWRYRHRGVVAFDLAGPESGFSSVKHRDAFDIVRQKLLNLTIHSGEAVGAESIQDSIRYCGAQRIGHGTSLREDPALMRFVIDRRIPLECCPSSNLHTKSVQSIEEHPLRYYFDNNVLVTVNTDNPTVSGVTLSGELLLCHEKLNFTPAEIVKLLDNGFRSGFVEKDTWSRLRVEAMRDTVALLRAEGFDMKEVTQSLSYDHVGVDWETKPRDRFWKEYSNPPVTLDLIRSLPKADLDRRFEGAMPLDKLWHELQEGRVNLRERLSINCNSLEELTALLQPHQHTPDSIRLAKQVFREVLQTPDQLKRAVGYIFDDAKSDNVTYMELVLYPSLHTRMGLTEREVLELIVAEKSKYEASHGIRCGVILQASTRPSEVTVFKRVAALAVEYKDVTVGFGAYGATDLDAATYERLKDALDLLIANKINVVLTSGRSGDTSIVAALSKGGATRLSGAFQLVEYPHLMSYLTLHGIPVERGRTDKLRSHSVDVYNYGDPIAILLDNNINVLLCTFHKSLYRTSMSEMIYDLSSSCKFTVAQLLKLIGTGFKRSFQPYETRGALFAEAMRQTSAICVKAGYRYLRSVHYFPERSVHARQHHEPVNATTILQLAGLKSSKSFLSSLGFGLGTPSNDSGLDTSGYTDPDGITMLVEEAGDLEGDDAREGATKMEVALSQAAGAHTAAGL